MPSRPYATELSVIYSFNRNTTVGSLSGLPYRPRTRVRPTVFVVDQSSILQLERAFRGNLLAYTEHVGYELLRHQHLRTSRRSKLSKSQRHGCWASE
jgi:hypothetical protein